MNTVKPRYKKIIVGYECSCGNKTDWKVWKCGRALIIECSACGAGDMRKDQVVRNA